MRPSKYHNLGPTKLIRIPLRYERDIDNLLSELSRLSETMDPDDILSDIINNLSDIEGTD